MERCRSAPDHVRRSSRLSGLPVVKSLFSCEEDTALTPVTSLALNMNQLSGLGRTLPGFSYKNGSKRHQRNGAINIHMEQAAEGYFLKNSILSSTSKRVILIFHCEFSSERGPRMCKFLREKDRDRNEYPQLHYPELYILHGGYKEFFQKCKTYCTPQSYCPMNHEDYKEDLRKFRMKSRTWAGERRKRELYSRLRKL